MQLGVVVSVRSALGYECPSRENRRSAEERRRIANISVFPELNPNNAQGGQEGEQMESMMLRAGMRMLIVGWRMIVRGCGCGREEAKTERLWLSTLTIEGATSSEHRVICGSDDKIDHDASWREEGEEEDPSGDACQESDS